MDDIQQNNLTPKEIYEFKKKRKLHGREKGKTDARTRKIGKYALYILIAAGAIVGTGWLISLRPNLPAISTQNHIEDSPSAHILASKIPDAVQRHMLEHSDGRGAPGIIIQYNCDDYECEPGMIQKLTALAEEYPDNVYLAPNNYDGKIILTRLGKRKILGRFNAQAIRDFIK